MIIFNRTPKFPPGAPRPAFGSLPGPVRPRPAFTGPVRRQPTGQRPGGCGCNGTRRP